MREKREENRLGETSRGNKEGDKRRRGQVTDE